MPTTPHPGISFNRREGEPKWALSVAAGAAPDRPERTDTATSVAPPSARGRIRVTRFAALVALPWVVTTPSMWGQGSVAHEIAPMARLCRDHHLRPGAGLVYGVHRWPQESRPCQVGSVFDSPESALLLQLRGCRGYWTADRHADLAIRVRYCICGLLQSCGAAGRSLFAFTFSGVYYREYVATVPRWIPAFRKWSDADDATVKPAYVSRSLQEGAWFFVAFPVLEGTKRLLAAGLIPSILPLLP